MAAVTEKWIPQINRRQDLYGFIDILAVNGTDTVGVQATSGANVSSRVNKILSLQEPRVWLAAGRRIIVHGWAKQVIGHTKKGKPIKGWKLRAVEITKGHLLLTHDTEPETVAA
jgi:hypothetical protein